MWVASNGAPPGDAAKAHPYRHYQPRTTSSTNAPNATTVSRVTVGVGGVVEVVAAVEVDSFVLEWRSPFKVGFVDGFAVGALALDGVVHFDRVVEDHEVGGEAEETPTTPRRVDETRGMSAANRSL